MNKTTKEMVEDAMTTVLTDMWYDENPYCDPEDYRVDFEQFCMKQFNSMLRMKENG